MINFIHYLSVDGWGDKWFIVWPDGDHFSGPYKSSPSAKSELTKMKRT